MLATDVAAVEPEHTLDVMGDGGRHGLEVERYSFERRLGVPGAVLSDCIQGQAWVDVLGNVRDQVNVFGVVLLRRPLVHLAEISHKGQNAFVNSPITSFIQNSVDGRESHLIR